MSGWANHIEPTRGTRRSVMYALIGVKAKEICTRKPATIAANAALIEENQVFAPLGGAP